MIKFIRLLPTKGLNSLLLLDAFVSESSNHGPAVTPSLSTQHFINQRVRGSGDHERRKKQKKRKEKRKEKVSRGYGVAQRETSNGLTFLRINPKTGER